MTNHLCALVLFDYPFDMDHVSAVNRLHKLNKNKINKKASVQFDCRNQIIQPLLLIKKEHMKLFQLVFQK